MTRNCEGKGKKKLRNSPGKRNYVTLEKGIHRNPREISKSRVTFVQCNKKSHKGARNKMKRHVILEKEEGE